MLNARAGAGVTVRVKTWVSCSHSYILCTSHLDESMASQKLGHLPKYNICLAGLCICGELPCWRAMGGRIFVSPDTCRAGGRKTEHRGHDESNYIALLPCTSPLFSGPRTFQPCVRGKEQSPSTEHLYCCAWIHVPTGRGKETPCIFLCLHGLICLAF